MLYESGEMYLETILELYEKTGAVRSVDLVNAMGFAKSSVSATVKYLKENHYILVDKDGFITLTDMGGKVANKIYSRHVLLTQCLEKLGVPSDIAEKDACKIEHDISEETYLAVKKFLEK